MNGDSNKVLEPVVDYAHKHGTKICFNAGTTSIKKGFKHLKHILDSADVVVMNKEEASMATGITVRPDTKTEKFSHEFVHVDIKRMLETLRVRDYQVVVITDGNSGAYAYNGKRFYYCDIFPSEVISTLGAGDAFASTFCNMTGFGIIDAGDFVLEGGSIHSDGEGTILTTESCLLSGGRNPHMTKEEITDKLCSYLGAEKVIWIPHGIYNDETNEHIDNIAAFIAPAEMILAWCDDPDDPQYAMSRADFDVLSRETDAKGRPLHITKLPVPHKPVCVTDAECAAYAFAEGEDTREPNERLAASYVNFYFTNHSVLVPQFGGENAVSDALAVQMLQEWCPDRKIVPIPAKELILGGGNIHCLTQQIPK